jgi:serine/threonine protein kinase
MTMRVDKLLVEDATEVLKWQVRLIDFGLALKQSVLQAPSSHVKSDAHGMVEKSIAGTVDYAAPEQMGKVDGPISDVYAFGKTCYYALLQTPEPDDDEKKQISRSSSHGWGMWGRRRSVRRRKRFVVTAREGAVTS